MELSRFAMKLFKYYNQRKKKEEPIKQDVKTIFIRITNPLSGGSRRERNRPRRPPPLPKIRFTVTIFFLYPILYQKGGGGGLRQQKIDRKVVCQNNYYKGVFVFVFLFIYFPYKNNKTR